MKQNSQFLREFSGTEQFTDACVVHRNLNVAAVADITNVEFTTKHVEQALARLQDKHVELRAHIKRTPELVSAVSLWNPFSWLSKPRRVVKPGFWTSPGKTITFQRIQIKSMHGFMNDVLDKLLQYTYEEGSLLFNLYWVEAENASKAGMFVALCHPAIADRVGVFLLLDDFLQELNACLKNEEFKGTTRNEISQPLLNCLNSDFNGMTMWTHLGDYMKFMALMMIPRNPVFIQRNPVPVVPEYTFHHIPFELSKGQSDKILSRANTIGVSLRAIVATAGVVAMRRMMQVEPNEAMTFLTTYEMDLRKFCDPEILNANKGRLDGTWCDYPEGAIKSKGFDMKNFDQEFNELAIQIQQEVVNTKLDSDYSGKMAKLCYAMMNDTYSMFKHMGTRCDLRNDFAVVVHENLDDIFHATDKFKINEVKGAISAACMGTPFSHLVNVFQQQVYYTLAFSGVYTCRDKAEAYGQATWEIFKRL